MKIPHILCVAYYKFNRVHHCFIMKINEILNRFFHVYAINVIVITCVTIFLAYFTMFPPFNDMWWCKIYHFKSQNPNGYNDTSRSMGCSGTNLAWFQLWTIVFSKLFQASRIIVDYMNEKSLVEKLLKITRKKEEEHKNIIGQREQEM